MKKNLFGNSGFWRILPVIALAALLPVSCMHVDYVGDQDVDSVSSATKTGQQPATPKGPAPGITARQLYGEALAAYKTGDYKKSSSLFSKFSAKYTGDNLADNALYWKGECFYARNEFFEALRTFETVWEKYPKGNKVPDSLFKAGLCCLRIEDRENALFYLKKALDEYPSHPASAKAGEALSALGTQ